MLTHITLTRFIPSCRKVCENQFIKTSKKYIYIYTYRRSDFEKKKKHRRDPSVSWPNLQSKPNTRSDYKSKQQEHLPGIFEKELWTKFPTSQVNMLN